MQRNATLLSRRALIKLAGALGVGHLVAGCEAQAKPAQTRFVTGPVDVPAPLDTMVTRWGSDPYAFGSYSYLSASATPADRETIGAPTGRVFFAGEAVDSTYPATTHGAVLSGRRAATQLADLNPSSVIVIGAGAAGLAAASALAESSVEVHIVEARDRIGGRVWTDTTWGLPLDLGASWIHGVKNNPVTALADEIDAPQAATDYDSHVVRDAAGTIVQDDDLPADFTQVTETEHEYGADVSALSPNADDEGDVFDGGDVLLPGGYVKVLEQLLPADAQLNLGWPVSHIRATDSDVSVSGDRGELSADGVIVTVPLGVLKAGTITFDPPLEPGKTDAINRLGMGLLNKVYLRFPHVFWDKDADLLGYVGPQRGYFAEWLNLAKFTGEPILLGFNAGSAAAAIEQLSDTETVDLAIEALTNMYS